MTSSTNQTTPGIEDCKRLCSKGRFSHYVALIHVHGRFMRAWVVTELYYCKASMVAGCYGVDHKFLVWMLP